MKLRIDKFVTKIFANWHVKAIALAISLFLFVFFRLSNQKEILVPLNVSLPPGYELAKERPESIRIILRGAKLSENLSKDDFKASVDLTSFRRGGEVIGQVSIQRVGQASALSALDFEVQPAELLFTLEPVAEKYVSLDKQTLLIGAVPYGYYVDKVILSQEMFLIRGPKSRVEKIEKLFAQAFDISGKTGYLTAALPLSTGDKLVRIINATEVTLSLQIKEKIENRVFDNIPVQVVNLSSGLWLKETPFAKVEIEGKLLILENVSPADLILIAKADFITKPGEYNLELAKVEAPAELKIIKVDPKLFKVKIDKK